MADVNISELQAMIAALQAQNETLKASAAKRSTLRLKVGEKGGVSLYGLTSRFPVTLYKQQWERVIEFVPEIKKFIAAHPELKVKE